MPNDDMMDNPGGHAALHAKVGQYFDGELASEDEQAVLDHLADCAICERALVRVFRGLAIAAPAIALVVAPRGARRMRLLPRLRRPS